MRRNPVRRAVPWVILLAALAALVIFVGIPLYSQQEPEEENPPTVSYYEGGKEPLVMENDRLLFEMDPATTQFTVTEKGSGRVWRSNPENADSDPVARAENKAALNATLIVTYTISGGEVGLNNYSYSIENQNYTIERTEQGGIRVNYTVGKIERTYLIPTAITKERFDAFAEKMSKSDRKRVANFYSLYSPDKLDKVKNKDEIIASYPEVQNQPIYVLKSDTKANNKKKAEGYFESAGYTQEDYELDMQLVANYTRNASAVFNVPMIYTLEGNDLVVTIPYEELKYQNSYPLTYLTPLPMFGAAGTEEEGFILVPEGGGALIRYNNGKLSQSPYYANLYGWDYGTERREAISETRDAFPVFGMTGGGGSFICIMEGASSYAGVSADVAGRYNSYNYAYSKYNVLHFDRYNVSQKTADLIYMYESRLPRDTLVQRYRFVDSDRYPDMATAYGDYLREHYPELAESSASEDTPVVVELIGAIDKQVVKFGVPVKSVIPTTTFARAGEMITELKESGIDRLSVIMSGWCNGGINQKVLTGVHVLGELGGESGMKKLTQTAREENVPLYYDGITCFAYDSGLLDGFLPFRDAARYTTREQIVLYPFDIVTYQPDKNRDPYYLVKPAYAKRNASGLIGYLHRTEAAGIAFRDIGNLLSADYYKKDTVTREQVKEMNTATMREAGDSGLKTLIREGNDYAVPYADLIVNMNLTGNAYAILDEPVPFYQIALHGARDYTGGAVNVSGDYRETILRCAEYGAGLYFCVMDEDTRVLQDSRYGYLCSAGYGRWKDEITGIAGRFQKELGGLNRLRITGHERVTEYVTRTEYEDGTSVYVNYGDEPYRAGGITVPARDYAVERGK